MKRILAPLWLSWPRLRPQRWLIPLSLAAAPLPAAAQIYPNPSVPPPPVSLDPGSAPSTTAPLPPQPQQPATPAVVVVGSDGQVKSATGTPAEPSGYYVNGSNPVAADDEPDVFRGGATPELHVVRHGDTLWDICFLYFNDPWQWPKIWSYNPQITNPHWIYPGDLVRLLPRGMFSAAASASAPSPAPPATKPAKPDVVPPPQRSYQVGIKQTAFVEKSDLDQSIVIDGAVDEKELLGLDDEVYLRYPEGKPPQIGKRYSIYVPGNLVKSGTADVGAYVRVLGTVEIKSVSQDKRARGLIVESNMEIERGAKVGPLLKEFHPVPATMPKIDAQGTVVAMLTYDQLIGQGELLFIDLGKDSGLEVGNRMFVVRRGDAHAPVMSTEAGQDDRRFPARALGQVSIVEVGERISVGLVTLAVQEMSIGDLVIMQVAK